MAHRYRAGHSAIGLVLLGVLLWAPGVWAQAPSLEADVVGVRAQSPVAGRVRLDVYTKVPHTALRFLNDGSAFVARYEVTAQVFRTDARNRRRGLATVRSWERAVRVTAFGATQAPDAFDRSVEAFDIEPGRYVVALRVEDRAGGRRMQREIPVEVRDVNAPAAVSDLIVVDHYDATANSITPNVGNRVGTDAGRLRLFYELYLNRVQGLRVTREVVRLNKSGLSAMRSVFGLDRDEAEHGEVAYTKVESAPARAGRTPVVAEIPISGIKAGDYLVRVRVEDERGNTLDMAQKVITVEWSGLDEHIRDLDQAIAQLSYIAKEKELRHIRAGRTAAEREARFRQFWDRRDPTPGTERNERMEEYYFRIAMANRQFGPFGPGWRTDRGHVAILFGDPDKVDRHPSNAEGKPYEVWYYYRIGRQFIFVDRNGVGNYQLMLPIWDERTRIR